MIDFPSLYPGLVKYLPNWLDRFYPSVARFAKGDGYPCGNKGVFIPRRNKCWTHPKTGQRMKKPLTYQMYKEAKEKSQKSRTEKGRTALDNREQGFRDKARERVKGWQKDKPENAKQATPFEQAAKKNPNIQKNWMRFNTLPNDIQEHLLDMLATSSLGGIDAIQAQVKLKKIKDLSDDEIVKAWGGFNKSKTQPQKQTPQPTQETTGKSSQVKRDRAPVVKQERSQSTPQEKNKTASTPKGKPKIVGNFYNDDPIKNYETFKKEIPKELARLDFEYNLDGLIPIGHIRKDLGDRIKKEDFDKWFIELQSERDDITLSAGHSSDRDIENGIKLMSGNIRDAIQFDDQKAKDLARKETKRRTDQIADQKQFEDLVSNIINEESSKRKSDLIPIYEIRRKLGEKVSRGDFNNMLIKMQANDRMILTGGEMYNVTATTERYDSIYLPLGGFRYYVQKLDTEKTPRGKKKKQDFNSRAQLAQFAKNKPCCCELDPKKFRRKPKRIKAITQARRNRR